MDEIFQAKFDDSEIIAALDRVEKQLGEVEKAGNEAGQALAESMHEGETAVQSLAQTLDKGTSEVMKQAQATNQAQRANRAWLDSIRQTILGQQIAGKTLGEWVNQAREFAQRISAGARATEGATLVTRIFSTALKATGIGLVIAAVAALIGYFTRFQSGIDKVNQVLSATGAVISTLIDRAAKFGSAVLKLFSGDFAGAANDAKAAVVGIGDALLDAALSAAKLEKEMQAIRDATITASVEAARQRTELEKLRRVVDDETQGIGRRLKVQQDAAVIERKLAEDAFDLALRRRQAAAEDFRLNNENQEKKEAFAKAEIELTEAQRELEGVLFNAEKERRELRKQANEEAKKAQEKRLKDLEAESKALQKIAQDLANLRLAATPQGEESDLAAVNKRFDELQKVTLEGITKLNEIEARRGLSAEEIAQRDELIKIQVALEERRAEALIDVLTEYAEKEIAIEQEQQEQKKALAEKDFERAVKSLETERNLRNQQIDIAEAQNQGYINLLQERGASEEQIQEAQNEFDLQIKRARLENELQFQQALLAITSTGDAAQVQAIKNQIQLIQTELGNLTAPPKKGGKEFSIWELVGVNDKEGQRALTEAAEQIMGILSDLAEARVREAEAAVQAATDKVEAAEDALAREQELKDQGLANDVTRKKQELEEAKKIQQEALKEQAKAQRAQILLDSALQLSSLITSAANIFKSLSSLPFGAGVPVAIALIGLMFGAFVKAKADALKAIPKYRKGTKVKGRTHEEGGEYITAEGHIIGEVEKDEWIIGTEPSREHDAFLERLNRGEFKGVNLNHLLQVKHDVNNPVTQSAPRLRQLEDQRRQLIETQHFAAMVRAYEAGAGKIVEAIESQEKIMPWKDGYIREKKRGAVKERKVVLPE